MRTQLFENVKVMGVDQDAVKKLNAISTLEVDFNPEEGKSHLTFNGIRLGYIDPRYTEPPELNRGLMEDLQVRIDTIKNHDDGLTGLTVRIFSGNWAPDYPMGEFGYLLDHGYREEL